MVANIYQQVLQSTAQRKYDSGQRNRQNLTNIMTMLDMMEQGSAVVGGSGSTGGMNYPGAPSSGGGGPSTGKIPPLVSWNWKDPIDRQRFSLTTAKGTQSQFRGLLNHLARVGYDIDTIGSYSYRNARGSNRLSEHAYGRAIDINPSANPMSSKLQTNMPRNIARIAANLGLVWGGTWKSKKDPMHFSTTGW